MTHIVTDLTKYDSKRMKVILDYGEMAFILYVSEIKKYFPKDKMEISEDRLSEIMDEILLPRAKKRALYFLKNADKTLFEIRKKLEDGNYPDSVIEKVCIFLIDNGLADDLRYARTLFSELKKDHSRCEIRQRLSSRGIKKEILSEILDSFDDEDEMTTCKNVIKKRFAGKTFDDEGEKEKAVRYLQRRGFSFETINTAFKSM